MPIDLTTDDVRLLVGALQRDLDDYNSSPSDFPDKQYDAPAARRLLARLEQESLIPF